MKKTVRLLAALWYLAGKLTGQQRTQAENAAAALEKAYAAAVKAERKSAENEGVRYALKRDFYTRFDAWDGKTREIRFSVGTTSEALRSIGVKDRQITWSSDSMIHSMKHEGMTKEILRQVPDILERPIMIMQSRTVSDRITVFGEAKDKNGAPVLAVVEINPKDKNGDIIDLNIINNSYGKDHGLQKFLENSTFLYLDPNKKRTSAWLQGLRLQLPSDPTMYGSIGSIAYENGEVKVNGKKWNDIFAQETDFTKKETVFDAFDPEYVADLMREGNVLYTKNKKSLSELIDQRREVPKIENGNALSGTIVTETGGNVNTKYSLKRDAALEKDFASIREQLEAGKLTEEQADRLREEAVNHPLTQADKLARIDRAGWKRPEGLAFVPVDFTRDSLAERLCSAGFDPAARAFFSWLGVTYYLPAEAVEETLAALSGLCAAGSALVFDYPDEGFFSAGERRVQNTILMAKAGGEPMRSAFSRPALEALLQKHGFRIGALLTPEDIQRDVIDRAGGALKAFEHVNYCLAIREE